MSDIAMLVSEEYDRRRAKNFKKRGNSVVGQGEFNMISFPSLLVLPQRLKDMVGVEKKELVNWVWEPKTQIAVGSLHSCFSA